ncbi:MAG TPA: hypothetical protein PLB52_02790 [Candidatus Moranbacteria bacterium]|nr:hypothetical protein [Candidatus Moranbacteria bacterium]
MKNKTRLFLLLISSTFFFINPNCSNASSGTIISATQITTPTEWNKAGSPYIIDHHQLVIKSDLTIEPGTVIKISGASHIYFGHDLSIKGTAEEKIIFTSFNDDSYGGDTNGDGNATLPARSDWGSIQISDTSNVELENVQISYANIGMFIQKVGYLKNTIIKNCNINSNNIGIAIRNTNPTIEGNLITDNNIGIYVVSDLKNGIPVAYNNLIFNNSEGVRAYPRLEYLTIFDARNNWWGDKSGPYFKHVNYGNDNLLGKGNPVNDGVLFDPWLGADPSAAEPACEKNCFSNVMFLPGIKASHLYKNGALGTEDELWIPNFFGNDINELNLDENGKSVNNVYTRDIIKEDPLGNNIYETFVDKLDLLKDEGTINDYNLFAYDWRQNVEDVAENGTPYQSEIKSAVSTLNYLAESSKSKKVTIIAHSNGGLLAKAIMLELEKQGLADKVDKIIFVGSPQMGTPMAILSMLYGYDESALFGTLISRSEARTFAENMPGAYGLLPTKKYFDRASDSLISFLSLRTRYKNFIDAYGEKIDSFDKFRDFLLGKIDGREKPNENEVEKENVLNENLFNQAIGMHESLDNWTPPANIEVIQIAGWGLDTISGVDYTEKEKTDCYTANSKVPSCIGIGEYEPIYEPKFTVDGDVVVVAPSALMISETENIKKYWMDLWSYNKGFTIDRNHKNILEVSSIQQFISNIINNSYSTSSLPEFIKTSRPNDYENAQSRLRMSLYSPLDINLYDDAGNHTGPKTIAIDGGIKTIFEEGIPDSYYYQFGDQKYIGFGGGENIHVVMKGYDTGSYTLKLEEVKVTENGDDVFAHVTFADLPTTADTTVSFSVPETGLANMTTLDADIDSDGTSDYKIDKVMNGVAAPIVTIETISEDVDHLAKLNFITDAKTQDFLQTKIRELSHDKNMIEKMINKGDNNPKNNQVKLLNKKIDDLVDFIQEKFNSTISSLAKDLLIKNLNSVKM